MWIAAKKIEVTRNGKPVVLEPGEPCPEADNWGDRRIWIEAGHIKEVPTPTLTERQIEHVNAFLRACCKISLNARVSSRELHEAYVVWCKTIDEIPLTQKRLAPFLKQKEFSSIKTNGRRVWCGLRLV